MDEPATRCSTPERSLELSRDEASPGRGIAYGVAFGMIAWGLVAFIVFA